MDRDLLEEKFKHHQEKLDDHEKRLSKLEDTYSTLQAMNLKISSVENDVKEIKNYMKNNSSEKGKKWDKLIDYIFYTILGLILSYIAIKIGIK